MDTNLRRNILIASGVFAAGMVGFFIGRQSVHRNSLGERSDAVSYSQVSPANEDLDEKRNPFGNFAASRDRPIWAKQVAEMYSQVEPGKPTPGFATLFKEAIDRGEPYSQGSVLMMIEGMRREDLAQALSLLKRATENGKFRGAPGSGQQSMVWQGFWNRFGELDPDRALIEVRNLDGISYFGAEFAEKNIFHGWALHDPGAAAQGFLDRPDLLNKGQAVQGITYEWALVNPQAATRWTDEHLTGDLRANSFRSMAYAVVNREGFKQGVEWWQQLTDEASRKMVFSALQDMANRRGPGVSLEDRVSMITSGLTLGLRDERLEVEIASRVGESDPASGADIFTKFPSTGEPRRYNALKSLVSNWTQNDAPAAGEWVSQQKGEPWYDSGAAGLALSLSSRDPAAAESWAATIENPILRDQAMSAIKGAGAVTTK
jgi:hypothetical protein